MDDLYWGIIGFVAVLSLMALGVHVGLALAATGFIGMFLMTGKLSLAMALLTTTPLLHYRRLRFRHSAPVHHYGAVRHARRAVGPGFRRGL